MNYKAYILQKLPPDHGVGLISQHSCQCGDCDGGYGDSTQSFNIQVVRCSSHVGHDKDVFALGNLVYPVEFFIVRE